MKKNSIVYSITIPVYNGEMSLPELIKRLVKVMDEVGQTFEIILVNDASPDNSWEVIKQLKIKYPRIKAFNLMSNVGQFKALKCAFDHVQGKHVITIDDDLQNPPEEIPKLIEAINKKSDLDCVFGVPRKKRHSFYRNLGTRLISLINHKIFDKPKGIKTSNFRIFKCHINDALIQHNTRNPVINPLILKNTRRIGNVIVEHYERKHGTSGYNLARLIKTTLDNVLNFSTFPLKLVSGIGLLASMGSLLLIIFYSIRYFQGIIKVQGWITLLLLISFFSGLILFSIGLVGEYLIRIIEEVNHSPQYILRDKI